MRILLVEDDEQLCHFLKLQLIKEGFEVDDCKNGEDALYFISQRSHDLVLLDRMLPGMDGLAVLKNVRNAGIHIPVILITALGELGDKITGLDCGADDYLVKPFDLDELLARIRAATRKYGAQKTSVLTIADLTVDTVSHAVTRGGKEIRLSAKEYAILEYLLRNKGTVISRTRLEDHIWNYDYSGGSNVVDVYITYLRKKIDSGFDKKLIHTIRGAGWIMKEEP